MEVEIVRMALSALEAEGTGIRGGEHSTRSKDEGGKLGEEQMNWALVLEEVSHRSWETGSFSGGNDDSGAFWVEWTKKVWETRVPRVSRTMGWRRARRNRHL